MKREDNQQTNFKIYKIANKFYIQDKSLDSMTEKSEDYINYKFDTTDLPKKLKVVYDKIKEDISNVFDLTGEEEEETKIEMEQENKIKILSIRNIITVLILIIGSYPIYILNEVGEIIFYDLVLLGFIAVVNLRNKANMKLFSFTFVWIAVNSGLSIIRIGYTTRSANLILVGIAIITITSTFIVYESSGIPNKKYQNELVSRLLKLKKENGNILIHDYVRQEDDDLIWYNLDPDWEISAFFNQVTIVQLLILIILVPLISLSMYYSINASIKESLYALGILAIIFGMLFFRSFETDKKLYLIISIISVYISNIVFVMMILELSILQDMLLGILSSLLSLFISGFVFVLITFVYDVVNDVISYVYAKNMILIELTSILLDLDLKYEIGGKTQIDLDNYYYSKGLITQSIENIKSQPILPNTNLKLTVYLLGLLIPVIGIINSIVNFIDENDLSWIFRDLL